LFGLTFSKNSCRTFLRHVYTEPSQGRGKGPRTVSQKGKKKGKGTVRGPTTGGLLEGPSSSVPLTSQLVVVAAQQLPQQLTPLLDAQQQVDVPPVSVPVQQLLVTPPEVVVPGTGNTTRPTVIDNLEQASSLARIESLTNEVEALKKEVKRWKKHVEDVSNSLNIADEDNKNALEKVSGIDVNQICYVFIYV
jgi:hypothetical protein